MGAVKSKSDHSAHRHTERQILQQPPYNGVPCEYHFIRIDIPFSKKMNLSFLSDPEMQMLWQIRIHMYHTSYKCIMKGTAFYYSN